jgi:hypothetical protein
MIECENYNKIANFTHYGHYGIGEWAPSGCIKEVVHKSPSLDNIEGGNKDLKFLLV